MTTNFKNAVIFGAGLVVGVAIGERVLAKARQLWSVGR